MADAKQRVCFAVEFGRARVVLLQALEEEEERIVPAPLEFVADGRTFSMVALRVEDENPCASAAVLDWCCRLRGDERDAWKVSPIARGVAGSTRPNAFFVNVTTRIRPLT